jgi:hypothetical protein
LRFGQPAPYPEWFGEGERETVLKELGLVHEQGFGLIDNGTEQGCRPVTSVRDSSGTLVTPPVPQRFSAPQTSGPIWQTSEVGSRNLLRSNQIGAYTDGIANLPQLGSAGPVTRKNSTTDSLLA